MKIAALLAQLSALTMVPPAMAAPVSANHSESAESKELAARANPVLLGALTGGGLATVVGGLVGSLVHRRDADVVHANVHASGATGTQDPERQRNLDHTLITPRAPQTKTLTASGSRMPWLANTMPGLNLWPSGATKGGTK
ncbi:hypothetical protein LTR95_000674 [Oleoguttula sp. CCFEE 5521]